MKKALSLLCLLSLTLFFFCGCTTTAPVETPQLRIALIPLDSRPCNTQYPLLLNQAAGASLELPSPLLLGNMTAPANSQALLQWLEDQPEADEVIIFANTLLNGGLIQSRQADAYAQFQDRLQSLAAYCRSHESTRITVVQILPRLIPSQFDPVLAPYADLLRDYGMQWDKSDAAGQDLPDPADIPEQALEAYRSLQKASQDQALALNDMAAQGLIDRYIVSADDGAAFCPANITFRALGQVQSAATITTHGADELTMMLVSQAAAAHQGLEPTPVRVVWSNPQAQDTIYPYESQTAASMVAEKLALAGLQADDTASRTLYIHANTADAPATLEALSQNTGCLAVADIACTNRGDSQLQEFLLNPLTADAVSFYSGWNTAANSIGTACAALRTAAVADAQPLSEAQKEAVFRALESFRAVRLGEDQLWMANLAPSLQQGFMTDGLCDSFTIFSSQSAAYAAQYRLNQAWQDQDTKLAACMNGHHTLTLGRQAVEGNITGFASSVDFPWNRAFEIHLTPSFNQDALWLVPPVG